MVLNIEIFEFWCQNKSSGDVSVSTITKVIEKFFPECKYFFLSFLDIIENQIDEEIKYPVYLLLKKFSYHSKSFSRLYHFKKSVKYAEFFASNFTIFSIPKPKILNAGRPRTSFDESSIRSKNRKVSETLKENTPERIKASGIRLLNNSVPKIDKVAEKMIDKNISATKILNFIDESDKITMNSVIQCLKLFVSAKLTANSYKILRKNQKMLIMVTLQPYYKLAMEKLNCSPQSLSISDYFFSVNALDLISLTTKRQLELINLSEFFEFDNLNNIYVTVKIGSDGARSGTDYAHHFANLSMDDHFFTVATSVLLKISFNETIVYSNTKPCSIESTRPIFFTFEKENTELTKYVIEKIQDELKEVSDFFINQNGFLFSCQINAIGEVTMIDGKVTNDLLGNKSTLRCPVCLETYKIFKDISPNDFDHSQVKDRLSLCLNPLHSKFKIFEFLLECHRRKSKYEFEKSNPNSSQTEIKAYMNDVVDSYKKSFYQLTKSRIDAVKVGYGTSNTGPNIKRAMNDPKNLSEILKFEIKFVENVVELYSMLGSFDKPNHDRWYNCVNDVFLYWKSNFSHFMSISPSMHKILVHGWDMINLRDMGPGFYSEESQERINKKLRDVRQNNTRKSSYKNMMEDMASYIYLSTDPIVNNAIIF